MSEIDDLRRRVKQLENQAAARQDPLALMLGKAAERRSKQDRAALEARDERRREVLRSGMDKAKDIAFGLLVRRLGGEDRAKVALRELEEREMLVVDDRGDPHFMKWEGACGYHVGLEQGVEEWLREPCQKNPGRFGAPAPRGQEGGPTKQDVNRAIVGMGRL